MAVTSASEILLILVVWALLVYLWESSADKPLLRGWMLSWSVLTPLLVWWAFRLRRELWRAADESVLTLLRLRLDRARGAIRMAHFNLWLCAIIPVITGLWLVAVQSISHLPSGTSSHRVWWAVLFGTVGLLAFVTGSLVYLRQRRREVSELERLLEKLNASP